MDPHEFSSAMPSANTTSQLPGEQALDEGVYVCVTCNVPGSEVSLLPGDTLPECLKCGAEARWAKT
jgi:hypothetical protein